MRTSQHAEIWMASPQSDYDGSKTPTNGAYWKALFKRIGFAQSVTVEDNFGTQQINFIGKPISQPLAGFIQSTVSIEVATIKGDDFRNSGAMNPLWAHLPIYEKERLIRLENGTDYGREYASTAPGGEESMLPFMFILAVKNKISNSFSETHLKRDKDAISQAYSPVIFPSKEPRGSNIAGMYACVLGSARVSFSSQNAIIMDSVTAQASMISGSWLNKQIKDRLRGVVGDNPSAIEERNNGVKDILSLVYGYDMDGTGGSTR